MRAPLFVTGPETVMLLPFRLRLVVVPMVMELNCVFPANAASMTGAVKPLGIATLENAVGGPAGLQFPAVDHTAVAPCHVKVVAVLTVMVLESVTGKVEPPSKERVRCPVE